MCMARKVGCRSGSAPGQEMAEGRCEGEYKDRGVSVGLRV